MTISRRMFIGVAISAASSPAWADLYDDYINSVSKQPFVSFFARNDTITGHAFIAVGTELDNGETVYEGIFGYYPANGAEKIMKFRGSGAGMITFKENDYPSTIRFRKNVDDDGKTGVLAVLDKWKSDDPGYNLLALGRKNCNSLAREVAQTLGLKLPAEDPGTTFPANYITDLRNLNQ